MIYQQRLFQNGSTLVEFILYIGLSMMMVVLFSGVAIGVLESKERTGLLAEINYNSTLVSNKIVTAVKEAEAISLPASGSPTDTLSLQTTNPDTNQTIFYLSEGGLFMKEGIDEARRLTTSSVVVTNLVFEYTSYENTPASVQVDMNIAAATNLSTEYKFKTDVQTRK